MAARPRQASRDVAAHPVEADHADPHCCSPLGYVMAGSRATTRADGFRRRAASIQRPDPDLVPRNEVAVVHVRVPVHERPVEHRMPHAAGFMLDAEDRLVGVHIDDVEEAVLVLIALLADQPALHQLLVRAGEVGQRDLDVVPVIVG